MGRIRSAPRVKEEHGVPIEQLAMEGLWELFAALALMIHPVKKEAVLRLPRSK